MNLIKLFKLGQEYANTCSKNKELIFNFPEMKIVRYIKFAIKYIPPTIIFLCVWQYYLQANFALTIVTIIFVLSLPVQGFLWLGKRAKSPIPLTLLAWYNQTSQTLIEKKILTAKKIPDATINFIAFMKLYNLSKMHLDKIDNINDPTQP